MSITLLQHAKLAPHSAGVYIFRYGKTPLYIGKAADLKKRLSSYFRANAAPKIRALRSEASALEWQETASEIEALIREAELIKEHLPKYNVLLRDDKSYYYAAFTRERFPRIFVVHKTRLADRKFKRVIGPFTSGTALFGTLRLLRRIFPYCMCKQPHKRSCVNAQIGRCLGFCCIRSPASSAKSAYSLIRANKRIGDGEIKRYHENIHGVIMVLSGKRKMILFQLKREMRWSAKKQEFEQAARLCDRIAKLENVFSHEHVLESGMGKHESGKRDWQKIQREIQKLLNTQKQISRVEGYDISNISGTAATGSMVVFVDGLPAKSLYRKFKMKTVHQANDVAMHQEMMARRLAHPEWGMPDLVVIDGGLPQLNAVGRVLSIKSSAVTAQVKQGSRITLTALAKREEELYIEDRKKPIRLDSLSQDAMLFFQHVRDESHRFAKKYHHKLREISYREDFKIKN